MSHHHTKNICPGCNGVTTCKCPAPKTETHDMCPQCIENVNEDAAGGAISAGAVAGFRGSLFGGSMPSRQRKSVKGIPVIRYSNKMLEKKPKRKLSETSRTSFAAFLSESIGDDEKDFDSSEIISKLSANAKVSDELDGDELAVFGLEDADGQITKVYVPAEEGKEFEQALGDALRHTTENGQTEIAALLFDLKDKFKIVDVKWPTVQEDEEQAPPAGAPAPAPGGAPMDPNAAPVDPNAPPGAAAPVDTNAPIDPNAPPMDAGAMGTGPAAPGADMPPASDPTAMIMQVLDMLKADAEARKAESAAKTAEAQAKESEAAATLAQTKMAGEEEALDAEAYFKAKKEEKKEADRIKMMAKFRQETAVSTPDAPQGPVKGSEPEPEKAPAQAAAPASAKDEEEEQMTNTRRHLLSLLNGSH